MVPVPLPTNMSRIRYPLLHPSVPPVLPPAASMYRTTQTRSSLASLTDSGLSTPQSQPQSPTPPSTSTSTSTSHTASQSQSHHQRTPSASIYGTRDAHLLALSLENSILGNEENPNLSNRISSIRKDYILNTEALFPAKTDREVDEMWSDVRMFFVKDPAAGMRFVVETRRVMWVQEGRPGMERVLAKRKVLWPAEVLLQGKGEGDGVVDEEGEGFKEYAAYHGVESRGVMWVRLEGLWEIFRGEVIEEEDLLEFRKLQKEEREKRRRDSAFYSARSAVEGQCYYPKLLQCNKAQA